MAEGIFLGVVVLLVLILTTASLSDVLRFYTLRFALYLFRLEKSSRNVSAEGTWEAHRVLNIIEAKYDKDKLERLLNEQSEREQTKR